MTHFGMEMTAFTKADHDAFAGAKSWEVRETNHYGAIGKVIETHPPLIGEGKFSDGTNFVLVADPSGCSLMVDELDELKACIPFEKQIYAEEFCVLFRLEGESKEAAIALFQKLAR